MSTLSGVRHAVRSTAARTRRTVMWTPERFRLSLVAATAVLLLVPLGSFVIRQPWNRSAATAAAATDPSGSTGPAGIANGLPAPGRVPAGPGAAPSASSAGATPVDPADGGAGTAAPSGPVDAQPLAVDDVQAQTPTTPLPSRSAGGGRTLSPDAANDRWKGQARAAALGFTKAWLAGATARRVDSWVDTLDPWLDPDLRQVVALTNLAEIPRTTPESVQLISLEESDATAVVELADRGQLDLELVWDGDTWRVASYEPVAARSVSTPSGSAGSAGSSADASSGRASAAGAGEVP